MYSVDRSQNKLKPSFKNFPTEPKIETYKFTSAIEVKLGKNLPVYKIECVLGRDRGDNSETYTSTVLNLAVL